VRVLLDTHVWLWLQSEPERLSEASLEMLIDPANELLLSAASAWEIAVKVLLGKLALPAPPADYVPRRLATSGTTALPVELRHALHVATLPRHHRDPFDRLLVAQAQVEGLPLVTADPQLAAYEVEILAAT
jgi:PIN domain nuclease of toxin-antitoxin system